MSTSTSRLDGSTSELVALGVTAFAGFMLAIVGLFQVLQGLAAIGEDEVFVDGPKYTYELDVTTWGWVHLVVGVIAVLVAIGILVGNDVARIAGVVVAALACVSNFVFLPYYPWWSLAIIVFNVAVIWALCTQVSRGTRL
ncbi:hypothetical protein [Aeromicrobium sp. IC_218]|uniref:DUF7144 family membrane protein n=1 Tax=Aeromicrobium sp. IC_218 TaxID=2545468 RepID=UPI00103CD362|nr:hypothetical protein [Aeromicrobium sp. IC_218]TCI97649.1 hypothetical protein E0W78_11415 [Aeromicrobium sp. IC_218]